MRINLVVEGQRLTFGQCAGIVVSDTINYLCAGVTFLTPDWAGLIKWAHFAQGDKVYDVMLDDDRITQDAGLNLGAGLWQVYIHGNRVEDGEITQRITTSSVELTVRKSGTLDGEPLPEVPPSAAEQILAQAEEAKRIAQSVRDEADAGAFDGAQGPKGETGEQGSQGVPGKDGISPTVTVERTETGVRITATDASGTTTADIVDGLDAPQIDDETASPENPWSGDKVAQEIDAAKLAVIDKVCPPLEQTGSVVQCYPVEGYPLNVVTRIEAVQEGEGDPSPENVRPIVGWDSLEMTRCGANIVDFESAKVNTLDPYNIRMERIGLNTFRFYNIGEWTRRDNISFVFAELPDFSLSGKGITFSWKVKKLIGIKGIRTIYGLRKNERAIAIQLNATEDGSGSDLDLIVEITAHFPGGAVEYSPYIGSTTTQALPETVYGGSYNWATGELVVTHAIVDIESYKWVLFEYPSGHTFFYTSIGLIALAGSNEEVNFSHYKTESVTDNAPDNIACLYTNSGIIRVSMHSITSAEDFAAYLSSQKQNGTPVTMRYRIKEPYILHLTTQQILSLPGVNTLFSNAGDTTVSGRADPIHLTQTMLDRLAALEAAQTGL